jgi:very-short-patch-repair endonuclease
MALIDQFNSWADQLVDLSGKNDLISFRQTKTTTLELGSEIAERLKRGDWLQLRDLFDLNDTAIRSVLRKVISVAEENSDQLGIETLNFIGGLAQWTADKISRPCAPFQLFQVNFKLAGGALERGEVRLDLDSEAINPVFLQYLRSRTGLQLTDDELDEALDSGIETVKELLLEKMPKEFDLAFQDTYFIKNLSYQKLPMVEDLRRATDALSAHTLIASLAGDQTATEALQAISSNCCRSQPNVTSSRDEFLILDADASQHWAINTALDGQNLVIEGPPGTGKSQTIANLIGAFMAHGRSVLFVAEKRAAIDAVKKRIDRVGLGELMLDLHDAGALKARPARPFAEALDGLAEVPNVDLEPIHQPLEQAKQALLAHSAALHQVRSPWHCSYYAVGELLVETREHGEPRLKFSPAEVEAVDRRGLDEICQLLDDLGTLPTAQALDRQWPYAQPILDGRFAHSAVVAELLERTDAIAPAVERILRWAQRLQPLRCQGVTISLRLAAELASQLHTLYGELGACLDLQRLLKLTSAEREQLGGQLSKGLRQGFIGGLFDRAHKRGLKQARGFSRDGDPADVQQALRLISQLETSLQRLEPVPDSEMIAADVQTATEHLSWLKALGVMSTGSEMELVDVLGIHEITPAQRRLLIKASPISERLAALVAKGISRDGLLRPLALHLSDGESVAALNQAVRRAWASRVEERMALQDPMLSAATRAQLDTAVARFRQRDREAIAATPHKIRRLVAERAHAIRLTPEGQQQERLIRGEAIKQRRKGRLSTRRLFEAAPDLLTALKPCWAMSPLVVSQMLPADRQHFDVVIFDEASQIVPYEAVTAILRGKQVVVAGDSKQLSPTSTAFFASRDQEDDLDSDDLDDDKEYEVDAVKEAESLLEAMRTSLPQGSGTRMLQWHYRSEDERLIAFSNAHPDLYNHRLITLPGAAAQPPYRFHQVEGSEADLSGASPNAEVARVVDLAVNHLLTQPHLSLAVLAFGSKHAGRIQKAFDMALDEQGQELPLHPPDRPEEKFRIRNLETIQGDERDVVIIATGYGLTKSGKPSYAFGPLNIDDNLQGLRRLNVAISRARKTVEIVSTINPDLYDPQKLSKVGSKAFIDYLRFAHSGGVNLGELAREPVPLNPFEQDIYNALTSEGLKLIPQYGVSGYRLDFAVQHPDQPGRFVLAIEADGAAYHSSDTARDRDRIRQDHLERLGWRFHRIWSTEWIHHRKHEITQAVEAFEEALRLVDDQPSMKAVLAEIPLGFLEEGRDVGLSAVIPERKPRPAVAQKTSINDYTDSELQQLLLWWQSDEVLRSDDEIITALIPELGFKRRGIRIVTRLSEAIQACRDAGLMV